MPINSFARAQTPTVISPYLQLVMLIDSKNVATIDEDFQIATNPSLHCLFMAIDIVVTSNNIVLQG